MLLYMCALVGKAGCHKKETGCDQKKGLTETSLKE